MERDNETFSHLLANPYHCKKKDITKTIDESIIELLQKKFTNIEIKSQDYYNNLSKIENIFIENHQNKIIQSKIDDIITDVIYSLSNHR